MSKLKRLNNIFESAEQIPFDNSSRIVLMSDCHRGDGGWADNFSKNENIYIAALTHYYYKNFTYIELGDGDELWETNKFSNIISAHSDTFRILSSFYNEGRLYFIFGNHDIAKRNSNFVIKELSQYYDERIKEYFTLFEDIKIHEGLVLRHKITGNKIFLLHGHQVDCLNNNLWRLSSLLVKYLWKPLEIYGVNDPTSTAKNSVKKESVSKKLTKWVIRENHMLIAGHTHRPIFPEVGKPPYFNDGSCVHPRCITAIEIAGGYIVLVKWSVKTKNDGILFIGREILAGPRKLNDYFKTKAILNEK